MEELVGEVVRDATPVSPRRLRVAMVTSLRTQCGVADYSRYLMDELAALVEVAWVAPPDGFADVMNEADVVHIQHQYFLFGGVAPWKNTFTSLADRVTAPAVMTVHEFVPPAGNLLRRMAIGSVNRAQFTHPAIKGLVVHTEADRENLVSAGVTLDRIHVMPHPVPPRPVLPPRTEARAELGVEGSFVLTVYGFLARRKGHLIAIEAMRQLPNNTVLLLAGGRHPDDRTSYVDELRAAISAARLDERVRITGYLGSMETARVMAATDLVLAPFTSGSGSGSLAYAFACGKPVVASAIPANIEIQRRVPGSLALVPPNDPAELASAITRLQRDGRALTRLTEGSLRYAAQHTYARLAEQTVALYHRIAESSTR